MSTDEKEMQLRRLALLLMSQVPDDPEEALKVLAYASELVRDWVLPGKREGETRKRMHSLRLIDEAGDGGGRQIR